MTAENRHFISLDEIVGLDFTCPKCGVRVSVPRLKGKWKTIPCGCPGGCLTAQGGADVWFDPQGREYQLVKTLVNAVDGLLAAKEDGIGCSLRVEIRQTEQSGFQSGKR